MDTSFLSDLNWLHVLVAALAYFALGAIWYSALFQKKWIAYQNINMNDPNLSKGTGVIMLMSFVWMLVATIALAIIINRLALDNWVSGLKWGLLTGICFSFMSISVTYLYVKKPLGLHLIDGMYHVTGQVIAAIILSAWK